MEKDVLQLLREGGSLSLSQLAAGLKVSKRAALDLIYRMAQQGTIEINGIQAPM
jgi:DNA-binding Lrp family transcriptional regulator